MKEIYEATYDVPELGVEAGDFLVVRPGNPIVPLQRIVHLGHQDLLQIMPHLGSFTHCTPSTQVSPRIRKATPRSASERGLRVLK